MNQYNDSTPQSQVNNPKPRTIFRDISAFAPHSIEQIEFPYIHSDVLDCLESKGWHFWGHQTPEEIDAYLRLHGYDPVELVKDMRAKIDALILKYGGAK